MTDLIVDGNSLYARAWYATAKDFIDANDVLRSALQTVFSLINPEVDRIGEQIDRTLFCWDGDHGRDKGERQEKPREYDEVREIFKDVLTALIVASTAANTLAYTTDGAIDPDWSMHSTMSRSVCPLRPKPIRVSGITVLYSG